MNSREIQEALTRPFDPACLLCKPGPVGDGKAMVIWYVDARMVADRLDEVVGIENWSVDFAFEGGFITCRLSIKFGDEWVTKVDVGSRAGVELNQPAADKKGGSDAQDMRTKGMFSGAFKRAAVMWGVGRYLYKVKNHWHPYDAQKKRFASRPVFGKPGQQEQDQQPRREKQSPPQVAPMTPEQKDEIVRLYNALKLTQEVFIKRLVSLFGVGKTLNTLNATEANELIKRLDMAVKAKSTTQQNGQEDYEEVVV